MAGYKVQGADATVGHWNGVIASLNLPASFSNLSVKKLISMKIFNGEIFENMKNILLITSFLYRLEMQLLQILSTRSVQPEILIKCGAATIQLPTKSEHCPTASSIVY